MKFTGHERDFASAGGAGDDLDYMHARHHSMVTGRFLSVDPAGESFDPKLPQSWNRYSYVQNNPVQYVDPSGRVLTFSGSLLAYRLLEAIANQGLHGVRLVIDGLGNASLQSTGAHGPPTPQQAAFASVLATAINDPRQVRIGVVLGDPNVAIGSYLGEAIDALDIGQFATNVAATGPSLLAHEVSEQTTKQTLNLPGTRAAYEAAHGLATIAQGAVSGYSRGATYRLLTNEQPRGGLTMTSQVKGNQTVRVIIHWANGNVVKVMEW
jgi:RHS repeat-associated protein